MKYSDSDRIKLIISTWEALKTEIAKRSITKEILLTDSFSQWAVTTPLYNIGEHVYNLSSELKNQNPQIPWSKVSGLRHRLVHDYDGVNWTIIVEVIFNDMEIFINQLKSLE